MMPKLLLTSEGLTNSSIIDALADLLGKKFSQSTVAFVPTASNVETGDKRWLIADLKKLDELNFKQIEITDVSAVDEEIWRPSFERADVIFVVGGSTFHLMKWFHKTGLATDLPKILENKVYVGISAGSMVMGPELNLEISQIIYEEAMQETTGMKALGLVDFYFIPHLNSQWFKKCTKENIEKIRQFVPGPIYALDDNSALKIVDEQLEVVSEGKWIKF